MEKIFDHSDECFQYGRFVASAIDVIEINNDGNFVVYMDQGAQHIYRGSCVVAFRDFNGTMNIIIS